MGFMQWQFIIKRFDPDKPKEKQEVIDTYVSIEGACRRTYNEKGFCYVEPEGLPCLESSVFLVKDEDDDDEDEPLQDEPLQDEDDQGLHIQVDNDRDHDNYKN